MVPLFSQSLAFLIFWRYQVCFLRNVCGWLQEGKKNEYKGERTVFSRLQCLGYSNISFVLLGICCVEIVMYFDYKQYLLTRSIIWIHSHAESPSLANIMVIANSEGFLHSMLATLPGVASMVPRLGMIRLLNWDLVQAPFVQTLATHRKDFPFGIFCDECLLWGVDISFPDIFVLVV